MGIRLINKIKKEKEIKSKMKNKKMKGVKIA